ncbi:hypothetical protein ROSA5918_12630 [Roseateles saccharophilus]|uniref:Uncharacterized protein n=1 Tax=Roseateles saccharophilus TaxID=304 RepID=A0A4R3UM85_ROSSA|nr:hypothetical protein EV671_10263 [Roseateles saccharophilus]
MAEWAQSAQHPARTAMHWLLALILKPFFVFGYFIAVAFSEVAVKKWMPECRLKRLLLRRW